MENMTVEEYKRKSREMEIGDARKGLVAHAAIVTVVGAALTIVNVTFVPEFLWCVFPVAGMTIGVVAHYIFGFRLLHRAIEAKELHIEQWR